MTPSSSALSAGRPRVPDHISLWGSLIPFRREFDQYVNLRPVRLMPGVPARWPAASPATSTC
jgi:tartrate dehydrogenase/decarboxylase / D-malate dehydrogenase